MEYPEPEAVSEVELELSAFAEQAKRSIETEKEKLALEKAETRASEAKRTAMNAITNSAEQAKMVMLAEAEAEAKRKAALEAELEARELAKKAVEAASEAVKIKNLHSEVKDNTPETGSSTISETSQMNEEAI